MSLRNGVAYGEIQDLVEAAVLGGLALDVAVLRMFGEGLAFLAFVLLGVAVRRGIEAPERKIAGASYQRLELVGEAPPATLPQLRFVYFDLMLVATVLAVMLGVALTAASIGAWPPPLELGGGAMLR